MLITLPTLALSPLVGLTAVFVLAIVIDYYVVWNVTHALRIPLTSVINVISDIIIVGVMIQLPSDNWIVKIIAFVAMLIVSIDVFGRFTVTHRVLNMFRKG